MRPLLVDKDKVEQNSPKVAKRKWNFEENVEIGLYKQYRCLGIIKGNQFSNMEPCAYLTKLWERDNRRDWRDNISLDK